MSIDRDYRVREDFDRYLLFGDVDVDSARKLHRLVVESKDKLFKDKFLQNILLNDGYEMEREERPENWFNVPSACWNKQALMQHLIFLDMIMDVAIRPSIMAVKAPLIIVPGQEPEIRLETSEGWDAGFIEELQRSWITSPDLAKNVRNYKGILGLAFEEFNLKTMLGLLGRSRDLIMDPNWKEELDYQEMVKEVVTPKAFSAMDSAYYNAGNRNLRGSKELYGALSKSEFGRFFILSLEEERAALANLVNSD